GRAASALASIVSQSERGAARRTAAIKRPHSCTPSSRVAPHDAGRRATPMPRASSAKSADLGSRLEGEVGTGAPVREGAAIPEVLLCEMPLPTAIRRHPPLVTAHRSDRELAARRDSVPYRPAPTDPTQDFHRRPLPFGRKKCEARRAGLSEAGSGGITAPRP